MDLQLTYSDTLPSGLGFTTRRMKGKHQEWLTKGKSTKEAVRNSTRKEDVGIEHVVADCLDELGGVAYTNFDDKLNAVREMLSADFAYLLLALRFFSTDTLFQSRQDEYKEWKAETAKQKEEWNRIIGLEREYARKNNVEFEEPEFEEPEFESKHEAHIFKFKYDFMNDDGKQDVHTFEVPLSINDFDIKPYYATWKTLQEIKESLTQKFVLPINAKTVNWDLLTVNQENAMRKLVKSTQEFSSSSIMNARKPRVMIKSKTDSSKSTPLALRLADLELIDIEALRGDMTEKEGSVNTTILVLHPLTDEKISVNIVTVLSFFFPSGGI